MLCDVSSCYYWPERKKRRACELIHVATSIILLVVCLIHDGNPSDYFRGYFEKNHSIPKAFPLMMHLSIISIITLHSHKQNTILLLASSRQQLKLNSMWCSLSRFKIHLILMLHVQYPLKENNCFLSWFQLWVQIDAMVPTKVELMRLILEQSFDTRGLWTS